MEIKKIGLLTIAIIALAACGGGGGGGDSSDTTPNAINLGEETDAALSTQFTDTVTITGINRSTSISITGGEYSLDGGTTYTSANGTVTNNQEVVVRATSAATVSTDVDVVLTVGGVSGTFTITTLDDTTAPTVEIAFPPPASMTEADSVTIRGTASDDLSGIESVTVTLGANELAAVDTSDDGSFSTWSLSVTGLVDGENTISVVATDASENTTAGDNIPSVMVKSDSLKGDFPDSNLPLGRPISVTIDFARNRAVIGDWDLATYISINLETGVRELFSDNASVSTETGRPFGLLIDEVNDVMYSADVSDAVIYEIDLENGDRNILSSNVSPSGAPILQIPYKLIFHPLKENALLVSEGDAIIEVDLVTGVRNDFSSSGSGDHGEVPDANFPFMEEVNGMVYSSSLNQIIVAHSNSENEGRLTSVEVSNGARSLFSDNLTPNSEGPLFEVPWQPVLDEQNNRLLVIELNRSEIISVVLAGDGQGERSILSSSLIPDEINQFGVVSDIFYDSQMGYLLVIDMVDRALFAVDVNTGERVIISKSGSL